MEILERIEKVVTIVSGLLTIALAVKHLRE